jgi:hypothetical protein
MLYVVFSPHVIVQYLVYVPTEEYSFSSTGSFIQDNLHRLTGGTARPYSAPCCRVSLA